jgi:hypothetical protein
LRLRARERIEDGRLPATQITRLVADYGRGDWCLLCDEPIAREQIEYEIEDPRGADALIFHLRCHEAWQLECVYLLHQISQQQGWRPDDWQPADG